LCAAALISLAIGAGSASAAKNICVNSGDTTACPAGSQSVANLSAAITAADQLDLNSIYVASGIYDAGSGANFAAKPVKIVGVGVNKPVITVNSGASGVSILTTTNSNSSIDNVAIAIPASTNVVGITAFGGQTISNVSVTGTDANGAQGINLSGSSPTLKNSSIDLSGIGTYGVYLDGPTTPKVDDITVEHASTAVRVLGSNEFMIRRLISHAARGVDSTESKGTISSSVLLPSSVGAENAGGIAISTASTSGGVYAIRVDNCTLIGGDSMSQGVFAGAAGVGSSMTVDVNSSIITGYSQTAVASGGSPATAAINLNYSRFSSAPGGGVTIAPSSQLISGDIGFVDAGAGNYRLTLGSQLVDAGDPAFLDSTDSATDADNLPRTVSRGSGNVRDIGAYEVQNSAPIARIAVVTAVPSTTSNTELSAAGSTDAEGDSMTYDWKFDGAPGTSGVTTKKMFITDGPHTIQLTVTDKTGASATTSTQVNVARGFLAINLRSQNATISPKGTFKITMSCPAEAISNCSGRLLFQTTKKVVAKNYTKRPAWTAAKSKPAYLQAARYVFSIKPGTTQKLQVRTYSTFQNVLGVHKKFQIQSSLVSGTTSNANLTANRATFTISAPKKKKK
jgi:hypothetical protein